MAFTDMIGKPSAKHVTFHTQQQGKWVDITTDELFKGKKWCYFHYLGHLPRLAHPCTYHAIMSWQASLPKQGVDDIICVGE